jgi:flagellin-like hook-associated protein FlgL
MSIPGISSYILSFQYAQIQRAIENIQHNTVNFPLGVFEVALRAPLSNSRASNALTLNNIQSLLVTANSALKTQISLTKQMKEISDQAANPSLDDASRSTLNIQLHKLLSHFQSLTTYTKYRGLNLLDGRFAGESLPLTSELGIGAFQFTGLQASDVYLRTFQAVPYKPPQTYSAGAGDQSIVTADLRGNASQDIITADTSDGTISAYLSNADGSYQNRVTYAAGGGVKSLQRGDFNGDGNIDLVAVNTTDSTASVFLGRGDGTFKPQQTFSTGTSPNGINVGDFNHDGVSDLVVTNATGHANTYEGNGDGTFSSGVTISYSSDVIIPSGSAPTSPLTVDVNSDGNMDIVTVDQATGLLSIAKGNGTGKFDAPTNINIGVGVSQVSSGDLNGDGKVDLVTVNSSDSSLSILLGNGDGTFHSPAKIVTSSAPTRIQIEDINWDGNQDLLVSSASGNKIISLEGNGDGTFANAKTLLSVANVQNANLVDTNHDGFPDLVSLSPGLLNISVASNPFERSGIEAINVLNSADAKNLSNLLESTLNLLQGEKTNIDLQSSALTKIAISSLSSNLYYSNLYYLFVSRLLYSPIF